MIKRVAGNAFFLSLSQIIARGIGFFYFIFLARSLGVNIFGIYCFTLSFIYNFYPVADFGLERLILRDISRESENCQYYFSRLLPLRILLSVISIILALLLGLLLGQSNKQLLYFFLFGLTIFPYNLIFLLTSFQNAKEKMRYSAVIAILSILFSVVFGTIFVNLHFSLSWILLSFFFGNTALLLILLKSLKKIGIELKIVIDFPFWKKSLSQSWVFAVLLIISVFYLRLSVILVGLIKDSYSVGIYSSGYKFIEALILLPQSLALALFPLSSRMIIDNKEKLKKIYLKGLAVLFLFSLPVFLIFQIFPTIIINLSYGDKFIEASSLFPVFGVAVILFFVNSLSGNIIQNSTYVQKFIPAAILNFIISLILLIILIPRYSLLGAAWGVVFSEIAGFFINNYFVFKIFKRRD